MSMDDVGRFCLLSGDYNEIHADRIAARRLIFGGAVVHGVYTLLAALTRTLDVVPFSFAKSISAKFFGPVRVGEATHFDLLQVSSDTVVVAAHSGGCLAAKFRFVGALGLRKMWSGSTSPIHTTCEEPESSTLSKASGTAPLSLPALADKLFPGLFKSFSHSQIATLLACSRLVGMQVPGRHSLLLGLDLEFSPDDAEPEALEYRVLDHDQRFGKIRLAVGHPAMNGMLTCLVRPAPVAQPTFSDLAHFVQPEEFCGQTALVVGGSRGLGEVTAKLLCRGGARVAITYLDGSEDADRLLSEAVSAGLEMSALRLDVTTDIEEQLQSTRGYSHLYYFATPRIRQNPGPTFDGRHFRALVDVYVTGLAQTSEWFRGQAPSKSTVWVPSTTFLNDARKDFREYAAAKGCSEALLAALAQSMPEIRFRSTRLPRIATDQTRSLLPEALAEGAEVMCRVLRELFRSDSLQT